MINPV